MVHLLGTRHEATSFLCTDSLGSLNNLSGSLYSWRVTDEETTDDHGEVFCARWWSWSIVLNTGPTKMSLSVPLNLSVSELLTEI